MVSTENSSFIDVLIIGAGPTGLVMAHECARYGLKCRVIDHTISEI